MWPGSGLYTLPNYMIIRELHQNNLQILLQMFFDLKACFFLLFPFSLRGLRKDLPRSNNRMRCVYRVGNDKLLYTVGPRVIERRSGYNETGSNEPEFANTFELVPNGNILS